MHLLFLPSKACPFFFSPTMLIRLIKYFFSPQVLFFHTSDIMEMTHFTWVKWEAFLRSVFWFLFLLQTACILPDVINKYIRLLWVALAHALTRRLGLTGKTQYLPFPTCTTPGGACGQLASPLTPPLWKPTFWRGKMIWCFSVSATGHSWPSSTTFSKVLLFTYYSINRKIQLKYYQVNPFLVSLWALWDRERCSVLLQNHELVKSVNSISQSLF